jgi:hypothetical protein
MYYQLFLSFLFVSFWFAWIDNGVDFGRWLCCLVQNTGSLFFL